MLVDDWTGQYGTDQDGVHDTISMIVSVDLHLIIR
jgi:hypothetical protein